MTRPELACPGLSLAEALAPPPEDASLCVRENALPADLALEAQRFLAALPIEAWELASTVAQPLCGEAQPIAMRFRKNPQAEGVTALRERAESSIRRVLTVRPYERLILNFSRYDCGDHLDSHSDIPSGSVCYHRRHAFVWHLSAGDWVQDDGGCFVDEEAPQGEQVHVPRYNTIITFPVPRDHRVTPVVAHGKTRFAAYGWVASPSLAHVAHEPELQLELHLARGRAAALLMLREPLEEGHARRLLDQFASLPMAPVPGAPAGCCCGDLCRFAISTDQGLWATLDHGAWSAGRPCLFVFGSGNPTPQLMSAAALEDGAELHGTLLSSDALRTLLARLRR